MASSLSKNFEIAAGLFALLALAVLMQAEARGQNVSLMQLPAPPPLNFVPRYERSQMEAARDAKARVRLSMELAEARLARAEQMTTAQQFESALHELGIYEGILEDALRFLKTQKEQKKVRDLFRYFDISLRSHGMRLETLRRTTPSEYAVNIKTVTDNTKNLRGEALNAFYGDTVIRDSSPNEEKPAENENTAGSSKPAPKEQP